MLTKADVLSHYRACYGGAKSLSVRDRVTSFFVSQLHEMLGLPVIRAKQDVAVKFDRYVVVDLMGERSLGDFEQWDEENEKIYIACLREATLNVQAFGRGQY